jgi:hypothetical protein
MRLPRRRLPGRREFAAAVFLCIGSLIGFPAGATPPDDGGDEAVDRYASNRLFPDRWTRESKIPEIPQKHPKTQKRPKMVAWEVSRYSPGTPPTLEQQHAATDLVERSFEAALRHGWADEKKGLADGYSLIGRHGTEKLHYKNDAYLLDDRLLDPDHPEYLMYAGPDGARELVAFMFMARTRTEWGPQIGGSLTVWHFHVFARNRMQCIIKGMIPRGFVDDPRDCRDGIVVNRTPEMMHVWLIPRPEGPFATKMVLDESELSELIEARRKEHGF